MKLTVLAVLWIRRIGFYSEVNEMKKEQVTASIFIFVESQHGNFIDILVIQIFRAYVNGMTC